MNVSGLNSFGFIPQAASAKGNAQETPESFDGVLSQKQADTSPRAERATPQPQAKPLAKLQTRPQTQPQALEKSAPQFKAASVIDALAPAPEPQLDEAQPALQQTSIEGESLPAPPSAPSLDGPFNDRLMNAPLTPPIGAPAAKQPAVAPDVEVDGLTRRVVWNDFLRKMKDDLGVSAEDMLNAFQSLSDEDLAKPPMQAVDKVVMALGLDGQQAQMAKQYFTELAQKTQSRSLGEELAGSQKQISLSLMSQRELDRRAQARSVDQIQQKFFMKGAYPRPQDAVAANAAAAPNYIPKAVQLEDGNVQYVNPAEAVTPLASLAAGSIAPEMPSQPTLAPKAAANKINQTVQQMQTASADQPTTDVDGLIKKFMAGQAQSSSITQAGAAAPAAMFAPVAAPPAAEVSASAAIPTAAAAGAAANSAAAPIRPFLLNDENSSADDDQAYSADASYLAGSPDGQKTHGQNGPSEFQSKLNQAAPAGPAPAPVMGVPDLVHSARVMVNGGGGEMKVTLAPDGLGEVAMKVSVRDGKVNVQMITESDEAKKLIERQLGELKTSLSGQNLHVDAIKVDTATNIGKQMEQQFQDSQRQLAQQWLEQNRQDQQGWRRSFFEVPAAKVYKNQAEAPRDVSAPSASSRRTGRGRLDLVA